MAKIISKTKARGTIQTTRGNIDYHFKRPFKTALNYDVLIDGKKYFQALTLEDCMVKLNHYVNHWK